MATFLRPGRPAGDDRIWTTRPPRFRLAQNAGLESDQAAGRVASASPGPIFTRPAGSFGPQHFDQILVDPAIAGQHRSFLQLER